MNKIDLISQDIIDKIKTVTALNGQVGLTVGGTDIDPLNYSPDLVKPFCWIVFTGAPILDNSPNATATVSLSYIFVAKVIIDYGLESDLISTYLPVLEDIINAVKGSGVSGLPYHDWSYDDMALESLDPDRMVWNIYFSVATGL